ncbi:MAG: hypothetical protein ACLQM8_00485 [Limisphaerales bacterium]
MNRLEPAFKTELLLLNRILGAVGKHYEHPITKQLLLPVVEVAFSNHPRPLFHVGDVVELAAETDRAQIGSAPGIILEVRDTWPGPEHAQHAVIWLEKKMIANSRLDEDDDIRSSVFKAAKLRLATLSNKQKETILRRLRNAAGPRESRGVREEKPSLPLGNQTLSFNHDSFSRRLAQLRSLAGAASASPITRPR